MTSVWPQKSMERSRGDQRLVARAVLCLMVVVASVVLPASTPLAATAPHAPQAALPKPKDISCQGWERDTVVVSWADEAPDETQWRVERNISGAGWLQVATPPATSHRSTPQRFTSDRAAPACTLSTCR